MSQPFKKILLALISLFILIIILMNLTPGYFSFTDDDGCTCEVSYTTLKPHPSCNESRKATCDGMIFNYPFLFLAKFDLNKYSKDASALNNSTSSSSNNIDSLDNITYLMKYRDAGPTNEKTIFVTGDNNGESLKIADISMTKSSIKTIYKFKGPSAMGFFPPFNIINSYVIVPFAGGDANDILIFSLNGDLITKGVSSENPELNKWLVSFDEYVKDNIVKVHLYKIDNSIGSAQIDVSTGKLIPGSIENLGKLQN